MIFYQGGPIDYVTHVPGQVVQSSAESEYNAACNEGVSLAHFSMLIHELLNTNPDSFPEEAPLIILDIKPDCCMANNCKET